MTEPTQTDRRSVPGASGPPQSKHSTVDAEPGELGRRAFQEAVDAYRRRQEGASTE